MALISGVFDRLEHIRKAGQRLDNHAGVLRAFTELTQLAGVGCGGVEGHRKQTVDR